MEIATILTVRNGSTRLPGKVTKEIDGKPIMLWIVDRLKSIPGKVIVATTENSEDDPIERICEKNNIPVYRGGTNNVVDRMNRAYKEHAPNAEFIFRALGDCPFIETSFVERAAKVMKRTQKDAFLWHLSPDTWPVYGAREFPYSIKGWSKIVEGAKTPEDREHVDKFFHDNRNLFEICYHEPPHSVYFRDYRLEIDWKEDFELVETIHENIGITSPLGDIIRYLDTNPCLASRNKNRIEKTGPLTTYDYTLRRTWMKNMTGKSVTLWNDTQLEAPDNGISIFCSSGQCFLGYGQSGILYTRNGDRIIGEAYLACNCGSGRFWKDARKRK